MVGDPTRLKQILINVLINSLNTSRVGDIVIKLKNLTKEGNFLTEFTITMSHAIDSKLVQNLFVPFTYIGDGGKIGNIEFIEKKRLDWDW